ncbi:hypothetical protein BKA61DRAFT_278784 [Leptodontidium sp. MPI-SDFR-AT-0119]|nr:hypothetical protein BKA61DRAFT_278784 [Leptodontidium sp. MPI-SDFR-AT-0119]
MENISKKYSAAKQLVSATYSKATSRDSETWTRTTVCLFILFLLVTSAGLATALALLLPNVRKGATPELHKRGIESPSNDELMWNTIAFGVPAFLAFAARMLNRGWVLKKFHLEDWLMCIVICFFACLLSLINVSAHYQTNLYPKEDEVRILSDPAEIKDRILGSKIVVALEQCMLLVTWGVKICVWTFLLRLHRKLPRFETALWLQFAYFWTGLFVIEILYFFVLCYPFDQYWALPVRNAQCATYHNYSIVQMVFNISSDIGLILTPLPMVWVAQLPVKRKLILTLVFGLASFTVMAAALNKYYNFASPLTTVYQLWYIRESSISLVVSNIICTWQLLQKIFHFRSFSNTRFEITDDGTINHNPGIRHRIMRMAHRARHSVSGLAGFGNSQGGNGGNRNDDTVFTDDTELEERKSRWDDRRRDTQFSVERDGDDAGPAILYRSMHNIA